MENQQNEQHKILWNSFLKGDDAAYAELYNLYVNKLFVFGMHFTSNREQVKDCTQDVFIKIYAGRHKLKPVENVKVYLYTAIKNTLFDLFKKEIEHFHIDTIEPVFELEYPAEHQIIETEKLAIQKRRLQQSCKQLHPASGKFFITGMSKNYPMKRSVNSCK